MNVNAPAKFDVNIAQIRNRNIFTGIIPSNHCNKNTGGARENYDDPLQNSVSRTLLFRKQRHL